MASSGASACLASPSQPSNSGRGSDPGSSWACQPLRAPVTRRCTVGWDAPQGGIARLGSRRLVVARARNKQQNPFPDDSFDDVFWVAHLSGDGGEQPGDSMNLGGSDSVVLGLLNTLRAGSQNEQALAATQLWELVAEGARSQHQYRRGEVAEGLSQGMLSAAVVGNLVRLLMSDLEDTHGSAVGLLDYCLDHAEQEGYNPQDVVQSLVEAGAIRTIVPLLTSPAGQATDSAVKLLCKVSELEAGRQELLAAGAMVPVLELLMDIESDELSQPYRFRLMRNMMAPGSHDKDAADSATAHTEMWSSGVTAVMIALLKKIMKAWSSQSTSPISPHLPDGLAQPNGPIHNSTVANYELQALSLDLAAWMQRWSGAWGEQRTAGVQDVVAAAAENMVSMISALVDCPAQVVIPDAAAAGQLQVVRPEDVKISVPCTVSPMSGDNHGHPCVEDREPSDEQFKGELHDGLEALIAEAHHLVEATVALAEKDRTCTTHLACAGLLFLHHLTSGLCPSKGLGTWQMATNALVPPAVALLDSQTISHRKLAAQVLTLSAGHSSDLAIAALQEGAVEKLVINLAASLRDPERNGYNTYASTLLSLKGQLSTLSTTNGFGRHVSETINADQCVPALVTLLRDSHPDSQHLALWALARVVSFTPTWMLQPEDKAAASSHLISQHSELYTDAQKRMQACIMRNSALPAVLNLVEHSVQTRALDSSMPAHAGSPAMLYGFSQLEVALVQVVQCFAVHQAFRPALVQAGIAHWLSEMLGRETGQEGLGVQDLAAEALYWLLEDDHAALEDVQQEVLATLKALLVAGSVSAAAAIWQLCKISETSRAELLDKGMVKTLVTLLANELSDDQAEPRAQQPPEPEAPTSPVDDWSTYLFSSYLPTSSLPGNLHGGSSPDSKSEPVPLAPSPSSPKHVASKRIMFVANAVDALASRGDEAARAQLREAGIVPLIPALMNSRDKQACVLGCRLAHALAADLGGRLALRCQSCVQDLMEVLACGPDAAQQEAFRALRVLWDTEAEDEHEQASRGLPSPLPGAGGDQPGWMHGDPKGSSPPPPQPRPSAMRVPAEAVVDVKGSSTDRLPADAAIDSSAEEEYVPEGAALAAEGSFGGAEVSLEEEDFILWATQAAREAEDLEARGASAAAGNSRGSDGGGSGSGSQLEADTAAVAGMGASSAEEWSGLDLGGDMGVPGGGASSEAAADMAADLAAELTAAMAKGPLERRAAAASLLEHLRTGNAAARLAARQAGTLEAAVVILRTELNTGGPDENGHWEGGRCAGQAAALLWQLAYQDSEAQARLRSLNIIPDLVVLLRLRGAEWIGERAEAAGVLMNLAEEEEGKQMIAQTGAIPHLVDMLSSTSEVEALMAAGCLASLALNSVSNQEDILLCGGLEHIASLLTCPWPAVMECSLALLSNLAASASNRPKMIRAGLLVTLTSLLMDTVWRDAATQPAASRWQGSLSTQSMAELGESVDASAEGSALDMQWLSGAAPIPNLAGNIAAVLHNIAALDHSAILEVVLTGVAPSLVQLLMAGPDYDRAYALALLRLMLSVPDEEVHMYLAGLGLVPALMALAGGDSPPALAAAAQAALCELSPSAETNALVATSGAQPLLAWALSQWEAPPGWTPPGESQDDDDPGQL